MKNIETIEIKVDDALALCYAYYVFDIFNENLCNFLNKQKNKVELIKELAIYSKNKNYDCERKIKQFYNKNRFEIDIINKYSEISKFIYSNYRFSQIITYAHDGLNEYMKKNEDLLFKIIRVLDKIKSLGFKTIEFNENIDFTEEVYTTSNKNNEVNYLENLEIISSKDDEIEYRTKESTYKIISQKNSNNKIILNNLTFEATKLPESISIEYLEEEIKKLAKSKKETKKLKLIKQ